jgi:hypothetical protein
MNKKALLYGILYSLVYIGFKLSVVLSGNMFSKFGFYYSIITAVLMMVPFLFLAVYHVRRKDGQGYISARDGMRIALTVLAVALVVTSIYNYVEFNWKMDEFVSYYRSEHYLEDLKTMQQKYPDKIRTEDFPRIIDEQISSLSAFKATTGKIFPMLLIGLGTAFAAAIMMKRTPKFSQN